MKSFKYVSQGDNPITVVGKIEESTGMFRIGVARYGPRNLRERVENPYSESLGTQIAAHRAEIQPYMKLPIIPKTGVKKQFDTIAQGIIFTITNSAHPQNPFFRTRKIKKKKTQ